MTSVKSSSLHEGLHTRTYSGRISLRKKNFILYLNTPITKLVILMVIIKGDKTRLKSEDRRTRESRSERVRI